MPNVLKRHSTAIIIPFFEDLESLDLLLSDFRSSVPSDHLQSILFLIVDDGSRDAAKQAEKADFEEVNAIVLKLNNNYGHQKAIFCGLQYCNKNIDVGSIAVMDSDGEDTVANLLELIGAQTQDDNAGIVVSARGGRHETIKFQIFYRLYRILFRITTGEHLNFGNCLVLNRHALARIALSRHTQVHFAAAVKLSRLLIKQIKQNRGVRYVGRSKADFISQVSHGIRAISCYSDRVSLRFVLFALAISSLCLSAMAVAVLLKLFGYATPGWFSIAMGILALVLAQASVGALIVTILSGDNHRNVTMREDEYEKYLAQINLVTKLDDHYFKS